MSRGIDRPGIRVYDGRREQAVPTALVWAAGAGGPETEEARLPLD